MLEQVQHSGTNKNLRDKLAKTSWVAAKCLPHPYTLPLLQTRGTS